MPLFNPTIVISAAPGVTGFLRLVLYEASAPTVEVADSRYAVGALANGNIPPPHSASVQVPFYNLRPVIHLASLYITNGVDIVGTLIANFQIDPRSGKTIEIKADWFIYADETPGFVSGTNEFLDPDGQLEGWDYSVDVRGFGQLDPDEGKNELHKVEGNGYYIGSLDKETDYVIQPGELHIIRFAPKIITEDNSTSTDLINDTVLLTEDTVLTASASNKLHLIQSTDGVINITLPGLNDVPKNKLLMFNSQGGSHKNAGIKCNGAEKIDWLEGEKSAIYLGQSENLWLTRWINPDDDTDKKWKVIQGGEQSQYVGEIFNYLRKADLLNAVFADGTLVDRDVFSRLWEHVQTLDPSMLVSETAWNTGSENKGKFSMGDGSTTFRLPLLFTPGFFRGVDGSVRLAGSKEAEMVGPHTHPFDPTDQNGISDNANDRNVMVPGSRNLNTGTNAGTENRPANIGVYFLVRT